MRDVARDRRRAAEAPTGDERDPGAESPAREQLLDLQRGAGNAAVSRLLLKDEGPPALRRKIVGSEGEPDVWKRKIAPAVEQEADREIARAIFKLHGLAEEIAVRDYQELRAQVSTGTHAQRLEGANADVGRAAELMSQLTGDYSAALSGHPLVKALWEERRLAPSQNKGILEVLEMFLFLYTNADAFARFADEGKLTPAVWSVLDPMFNSRLGALIGGKQEQDAIAKGELEPGTWLKLGLDVVEAKLAELSTNPQEREKYVGVNLDNDTKAYNRKLGMAKAPPGGALRGNTDSGWFFKEKLPYLSTKDLVTAELAAYMREKGLDIDSALALAQQSPMTDDKIPSKQELADYIAERRQEVVPDVMVPLATITQYQRLVDGTPVAIKVQDALSWRNLSGEVLLTKDGVVYKLLKVRSTIFDLAKQSS